MLKGKKKGNFSKLIDKTQKLMRLKLSLYFADQVNNKA